MNKLLNISDLINQNASAMAGVFSSADIANLINSSSRTLLPRALKQLEASKILLKFIRGFYVVPNRYDPLALSQKLCPDSYISFETILAKHLVINPVPLFRTSAVKLGRKKTYLGCGQTIEHVSIDEKLFFGFDTYAVVQLATPEKAFLDCLYFHLHGRQAAFDIYSDLNYGRLNQTLIEEYLKKYKNKKFITFVKGLIANEFT